LSPYQKRFLYCTSMHFRSIYNNTSTTHQIQRSQGEHFIFLHFALKHSSFEFFSFNFHQTPELQFILTAAMHQFSSLSQDASYVGYTAIQSYVSPSIWIFQKITDLWKYHPSNLSIVPFSNITGFNLKAFSYQFLICRIFKA